MKNKQIERTIIIDGKPFSLKSDDQYLSQMKKVFEPDMVRLFKCLIKPTDIVADIGANIGMTSILFSSIANHVYSFEPSPSTFKILRTNLDRAQTKNVDAFNIGLGEKNESQTITFSELNRSGAFVSDKTNLSYGHVTEKIIIKTLSGLISSEISAPNFIKIDVEGYETQVIKGALDFIESKKPTVVLELNHFCLNILHRITVPDFIDFLRSVFPFLYAIDTDNTTIKDLHDEASSYEVMYEHVVNFRFPNIVGGFYSNLFTSLKIIKSSALFEKERKRPLINKLRTPYSYIKKMAKGIKRRVSIE